MERININDYYMNIAVQVSLRSTCSRRRVGAVIVKNNNILSTGYNGSPSGLPNCIEFNGRCYRSKHNIPSGEALDKCYAVHAEQNAIMNALKNGNDLQGASIYVTTFPCSTCSKLIIQSGIKELYYIDTYNDLFTKELLKESGIKLQSVDGSIFQTPKGVSSTTVNDLDSIDPLLKEIYKYEPGTLEFSENRRRVFEKNNLFSRYNEIIYYTKDKLPKEIVPIRTLDDIESIKMYTDNRNNLEYNGSEKKQMVVATVVYDCYTNLYYLLKAKGNRFDGKLTMIQGHAAKSNMFGNYNILLDNLLKELKEEINLKRNMIKHIIPEYLISTNDNIVSSEHMGLIALTVIDSSKFDVSGLVSGEPEKHDLVKLTLKELTSPEVKDKMDTWLRKYVDEIIANLIK